MAVFFSLDTQFENLGDEVINALLLREIASRQPLRILTGKAPGWYRANIATGIGATGDVRFISDRKRYLRDFLLGSLLPPGHIMLLSCGDVTTIKPNPKRSRMMSALTRLPFLHIAQIGASRLKLAEADKTWLARAAGHAGRITVRDDYSRRTLEDAGIRTRLLPDLAFLLEYRRPDHPTKALFMFRETDADADDFAARLSEMATRARLLGLDPVFGWQVARDEGFNRALAERCGAGILALPGNGEGRMEATLQTYEDVAVIVSNRLHGLLLAASRGALPMPMLRDSERKVRGVFEHAGLAGLILSDSAVPGAAADSLAQAMTGQAAHVDAVERAFRTNAADLRQGFDALFGTGPAPR